MKKELKRLNLEKYLVKVVIINDENMLIDLLLIFFFLWLSVMVLVLFLNI